VSSSQFQSPPVGAVIPPWVLGTVAALEEEEEDDDDEEEEEEEDEEGAEPAAAAAAPLDEDEDEDEEDEGAFLPAATNADDVAEPGMMARGAYSTGAGAAAGAKFGVVDEVEALAAPGPPIDTAPISFARRSTAACSLACSLSAALLPLLAVFLLIGAALAPVAALVGLGPRVAAEVEVVVAPAAAALLSWKMSNLCV